MSNILKVTSPIGGYENGNNIKMNPTANAEVQGVQAPITPQKVSRPGGRDDAGQNSTQLKLNYESNFNHFIKLLNNSPDQVEDLMRLLMEKKELLVQAGMNKGTAEDIARFFSMIGLKEGNMSAFLKEQADMGIRYRGPFFDLLRQVFNNTDSVDLKAGLLDFVRRYGDMASGGHIMQSISELLEKYPYEVSGGQKQRAAVARALITNPRILLADEPTGALDSRAADELMRLFESVNAEGQTIVMVTHDPNAAAFAQRALILSDGRLVDDQADPTADTVAAALRKLAA